MVASVNASAGATLNKGDTVLSVYPDDSLEIEIDVEEYDLGSIAVGDEVSIRFNWDENGAHDAQGDFASVGDEDLVKHARFGPSYSETGST